MRLLAADYLCPVDWRIDHFLREYLYDTGQSCEAALPAPSSWTAPVWPANCPCRRTATNLFPDIMRSYHRLRQGVLHNPANDRRIDPRRVPRGQKAAFPSLTINLPSPKITFARLLQEALKPPVELLRLPFTSSQKEQAECFVSLLMRPIVCPAVSGFTGEKSMEIRFFAPGNLVSNLDFVESIFGNAGDPFLPENDAGLDVEHWTGHTGWRHPCPAPC